MRYPFQQNSFLLKKNNLTPRSRSLLTATLLFLFLVAFWAPSECLSQEIIWTPELQSADASSFILGPNNIEGPTKIYCGGSGDPLPLVSPVNYPGSCGGAWARAEAGVGYVEAHATAWRTLTNNSPSCDRDAQCIAKWTGSFSAQADESFLFRVEGSGFGSDYGNRMECLYIPNGSTSIFDLFDPIINFPNGRFTRRWVSIKQSAFCTLGLISAASADNENSQIMWESKNRLTAQVYRLGDEVDACDTVAALGCANTTVQSCANRTGYKVRVKKVIEGQESKNYIGACLYSPGDNSSSGQVGDSKYRWVNYASTLDKVEVYTYDCVIHKLQKVGYLSMQAFKADKGSSGDLTLQHADIVIPYTTPPTDPADPIFFKPFYSQPSQQPQNALPRIADGSADPINWSDYSPFATITCLSREGAKWNYGLVVCDWVGVIISPGDTLSFEGPGITGGYVTGNAATNGFGAWRVKNSASGKIVFEATATAELSTIVDDFVVLGDSKANTGEINFVSSGIWVGISQKVPGPAPIRSLPWLLLLLLP